MKKNTTHTFKIPEGYFDHFYERLMDSIAQEEAEVETAIIPKPEGFVVPKGYFESRSKNRCLHHPRGGKHIVLKPYRTFYYYAAAVAALLLLLFGVTWKTEATPIFETLADAEIEVYFENDTPAMGAYEIAEVLSINPMVWNHTLQTDVTQETLWDYLSEPLEDVEILTIEYDAHP